MSYSMTGFGRAELQQGNKQVVVEMKSLNGKSLELNLKLPGAFRAFENDIRKFITAELKRGSVECRLEWKQDGVTRPLSINHTLAQTLYREAKQLSDESGSTHEPLWSTILRLPEVVSASAEPLAAADGELAWAAIKQACQELLEHRKQEGDAIVKDLNERINTIQQLQDDIVPLAPLRMQRIRSRIKGSIDDLEIGEQADENRLEQELIYYVEKIDFTEEQIRLSEHCRYFLIILQNDEPQKGKKLGFVLQEIGREINTLGSKANDAAIQKIVINMKDELEKAKEQVLNLL